MKYEFVRFKTKSTGEESNKWWFAAKTIDDVIEHSEKFFKPTMQEGYNSAAHDAITSIKTRFMPHPTNKVAESIEVFTEIKGFNRQSPIALFDTANNLMFEAVIGRIRYVAKGYVAYLEDGVRQFGYTPNDPHYEIAETYYSDKLEYPNFKKPTLDDVKYIQWNGGTHWYVKVNKEDVVDELGNQKWNTKKEAEEAAEWYIGNYY